VTKDLYTTKDVALVREQLLLEQDGYDKLTLTPVLPKQACLDHNHDTLLVRGVLNRQSNAALGKLEGVYTRYLSYWYEGTLSTFLRQAAEYLERPDDTRWRHPHFLKKLKTSFNKLPEGDKSKVLKDLGYDDGKNSKDRKVMFAKLILDRNLGYEVIHSSINQQKGVN
jgi:hypothetical protein